MKSKKAQGATEFIIIIAVALAVLLVLFAFNTDILSTSNKQLQETKARTTINDIADAAEFVHQQGVGSKTRVYATIPEDVVSTTIENGTIKIEFVGGEVTFQNLDFSINGSIPTDDGSYWFCIESTENSVCSIEVCPDTNATVPLCGDNVKDQGESCDGVDLNPYTTDCNTYPGYDSGTLACHDNCTFDFSSCTTSDNTPPGSITNLANQSQDNSSIYWTWTNPVDADFNETIVYLDNNHLVNTTNSYYNATGLIANTNYTITVHTKDHTGNINNTDVNSTAATLPNEEQGGDEGFGSQGTVIVTYYDTNDGDTPRYKIWNGSEWGDENSANDVGGNNKHWHILESSRTRDEIIFATQDDSKDINVQVWNGSEWGAVLELSTNSEYKDQRNVDIAYETDSDRAIIAYLSNSDDTLPRYRIWDGTSWSSEYADVQEVSPYGHDIRWIELVSRPNSNEILMITMNNYWDLYVQVWDGSEWSDLNYLEDNPETVSYQNFDAVCEQVAPYDCMVAWSDGSSNQPRYKIWDGTGWSSESSGNSVGSSNIYWVELAADPSSDDIALGTLDSGKDLNVQIWDGSSFGSNTQLDSSCETNSRKGFDLVYETNSSQLMVAYGDRNDDSPDYYIYDGSWSSKQSSLDIGGDQNWVDLYRNPNTDEIMMICSDNQNNDLAVQRWTGTEWTDYLEIESQSSANREGFSISY